MEYDVGYEFLLESVQKHFKSIVPLYKMNKDRSIPEFVGSSVYCQFEGLGLLFTAGHVLQEIWPERPWYPYSIDTFTPLPCDGLTRPEGNQPTLGSWC